MKRIQLLLVLLVFGLLSACGAMAEEEPEPIYVEAPLLQDRLGFDWATMTYSKSLESIDILRNSGTITEDYWLMREIAGYEDLTPVQQGAYNETLLVLDSLDQSMVFDLDDIVVTTLSDLNDYAASDELIEITPTIAFTYIALQSEVESLQSEGSFSITRLEYLEIRLDRSLTSDEVNAVNLLQYNIVLIYVELSRTYTVSTESFDGLITLIETATGEIIEQDTIDDLQIGYDIIQELHNIE